MAKYKEFIINRNKYKEIKTMDHAQMNEYINGVRQVEYENGYKIGRVDGYEAAVKENALNSTEKADFDEFESEIRKIKGIGEVKAAQITDIVRRAFGGES